MQSHVSIALFFALVTGFVSLTDASDARALCGGPSSIGVSPSSIPDGTVSVLYEQTFVGDTYTGFNYSIRSGTLPPGLTLASDTGVLSGIPTVPGEYMFEVRADLGDDCDGSTMYTMEIVVPDGGVGEPDSGTTEPDASSASDAGVDAGPDARGGASGCNVGGHTRPAHALWLGLLVCALIARRRRRSA